MPVYENTKINTNRKKRSKMETNKMKSCNSSWFIFTVKHISTINYRKSFKNKPTHFLRHIFLLYNQRAKNILLPCHQNELCTNHTDLAQYKKIIHKNNGHFNSTRTI